MLESVGLILLGVLAAFAGSIVGLGGGFIIVPAIALLYDWPAAQIVGTSMVVLVISALSSSVGFWRQGRIDVRSGLWFAVLMVPGSFIGAWLTTLITDRIFFVLFGCFLLLMAAMIWFRPSGTLRVPFANTASRTITDASGRTWQYAFSMRVGLIAAFATGFVSSLFGIGGGSLMVPVMVMLLRFPPHLATATSMFAIFFSAIVGTGAHAHYGHIEWEYAFFLAGGAMLGGQLGAAAARKLNGQTIMKVLAIVLALVAMRLIFKS